MEFKLINPPEELGAIPIEFNFFELKTELTNSLEKYKNLVYTDEQIKEAKTDRAKLNKFKETLNAKKIEIKKMCLAPYNEFESEVKELLALVDEPILAIDTQVKAFEDKKAQAKREELENHFNWHADRMDNVKKFLTFEKILNPKWLNTTYAIKKAKEDLANAIDRFEYDFSIIKNQNFPKEMELQIINKFLENLSLSEALAEKTKLEALKSNLTTIELNDNTDTSFATEIDFATKYKVVFEVEATKEQLQMIKRFLIENKIKYGSAK